MRPVSPNEIDAILPQTQCGLCGHGGCMPYAEALTQDNAAINLCPPGGVPTLQKIGALLNKESAPFIEDMQAKAKPVMQAVIREAECIGCTKCIQACPVDAILGAAKEMHTVIGNECTGCELCVAPCPVDCIDLVVAQEQTWPKHRADHARERFNQRTERIAQQKKVQQPPQQTASLNIKKSYIHDAIARAKAKRQAAQDAS